MAETDPSPTRPAKPRRLVRRVVLLLLLAVAVTFSGVYYLTRPARLNRAVTQLLEGTLGCSAQVGPTRMSLGGVLTVDGLDLTIPGETGEAARLFHADHAEVELRLWPLLLGRVRAASVSLKSPKLYLTEDLDDGRFNYEKLIADAPELDGRAGLPEALPELFIRTGVVDFGQVSGGRYTKVDGLDLAGMLTADPDRRGVYRFVLSQDNRTRAQGRRPKGAAIHGTIDLETPSVQVQVDRFKFTDPHRYLLPQAVRSWWDRLTPEGALPRVVFSAGLDGNGDVALAAEMNLDGIALTLPIESKPLRVAGVTGTVRLTGGAITFESLSGEVEGIEFVTTGRVGGFEAAAPFTVSVTTQPFDVPAQGGLWDKVPPKVKNYQRRFAPHGRYQSQVTIERPALGGELLFSGHLDLLDTEFTYHKFPYPAKSLIGRITFDDKQVVLHDLVGVGPSGGRGVVSGTITPPGPDSQVDLTIRGEGFPLDRYMIDAMKPKHRKVVDMFFDRAGYEELVAQGVIRPGAAADGSGGEGVAGQADQAPRPSVFDLGGSASMVVKIQRPAGKDKKYRVTTDIDVAGLRGLFSFWHFPVYADSGQILITPDHVQISNLRLLGVGGGGGVIDGRLILPSEGRPLAPSLHMTDVWLPIDPILVASIPPPKNQWVRSLELSGVLAGTGEIYADRNGKVAFTLDGQLQHATATPNGGGYELDDIRGSVTVERTRVQLEDLAGRHGEGTITLNGQADWGAGGVGVDMTVTGDALRLEPGLIHLLPIGNDARPALREMFETYSPDGRFDSVLHYQGGDGLSDRYTLSVEPGAVAFDVDGERVEMEEMAGEVTLTPDKATLHAVTGRFESGTFVVDGDVRFGDDPGIDLLFDVQADRIDPAARAMLPAGVLTVIDSLSLDGPYRVDDARVLTRPQVTRGPAMIFEGKVSLVDARAQIGVPISEINAELDMHVVKFADRPWPHTDIRITAEHLRAADRLLNRLSLNVSTGEQPWLIDLNDLKGSIYGGTLIGKGQISLGDSPVQGGPPAPGVFSFDMSILESQLEPFLHPLEPSIASADTGTDSEADDGLPIRDMASGLLSASFSIHAPLDDPTQRQGRGVATVRDAKLYDRPLSLALLQAANLALPNERSFDRASARYLVFGDTVLFDDIRFEAPAFVIAGTGTMDYPTTELDLRMVTHNPGAPDLGPVSDLVRTFKDELVGIEVKGTLAEPQSRVVTLEGFFKSWGRIFGDTSAQITDDHIDEPITETP